jgi:putative sigma-54 modulation protein
MRIEFTGRQMEVGAELRRLAERKLAKLQRSLPEIDHVHVVLSTDRNHQSAEVSLQSPHLSLVASEQHGDVALALTRVLARLQRQAERHLGKRRQRKRRAPARATALWSGVLREPWPAPDAAALDGDGHAPDETPRIVRSRRFLVKPLSIEEALLELDANDEGVVVFREARSERVHVLYRRRDGSLGLIEPEA